MRYTQETVRELIDQADQARGAIFEIRNLLAEANRELIASQPDLGPAIPLDFADLQRAAEAAETAANKTATEAAFLHRNLMTVLGYVEAQLKMVRPDEDLEAEARRLEQTLGRDNLALALARAHRDERALYARLPQPPTELRGPATCPNGHPIADCRKLAYTQLASQIDIHSFYTCGSTHVERRTDGRSGATGEWNLSSFCKTVPNVQESAA